MTNTRSLALATALLFASCVSAGTTQSGFLTNYEQMHADPNGGTARVWAARVGILASYECVLVEPLEFRLAESSYGGVREDDLARLSESFDAALDRALGARYTVVTEPGPGVLRLRVALTHLVPTRPILNAATQFPPARMVSTGKKLLTGSHIGVGRVGVEAELTDSASGELLVTFADTHVGKKFDVLDGLTTWRQIDEGFESWAMDLRRQLDQVHRR